MALRPGRSSFFSSLQSLVRSSGAGDELRDDATDDEGETVNIADTAKNDPSEESSTMIPYWGIVRTRRKSKLNSGFVLADGDPAATQKSRAGIITRRQDPLRHPHLDPSHYSPLPRLTRSDEKASSQRSKSRSNGFGVEAWALAARWNMK